MLSHKPLILQSINPATREVLGDVPVMGRGEVEAAVGKAWSSCQSWQVTPFHERARKILTLRRLIERQSDEIANLVSNEVGKPLSESYLAELTGPLETCVWLVENAERMLKDQIVPLSNPLLSSKQSIVTFDPLGVIGVIAPWNYPFSIPMMTILMAVMSGNTVVLKPSEKSPLVGIKIGELFQMAGFPQGVVSVVTGDRVTGEYLSRCKLGKLVFTGSVIGGTKVMAQVAPNLTPLILELGGKDAAIVLPDAPPDWTARGLIWGAFTNAGQACASIERIYIVKGKETDALIERIVHHAKLLKLGQPSNLETDIGPVIDETQLQKVVDQVEQARQLGAKVLCGGNRRDDLGGFFFEPTVLTDVNHSMEVMNEETFGPVVGIMVVDSEDEAIELANQSDYGLTASVWGNKLANAEAVARDLDAGTVLINDCLFSHASPQVPWGGIKKSGFGRTHSYFGLMDLVNIKHISIDSAGGAHRLWWYPYNLPHMETARGGLRFLHGPSLWHKLEGLHKFVTNVLRRTK